MTSVRQENRYRRLVREQADAKTAHLTPPAPVREPRQPVPQQPAPLPLRRRQIRAWMRRNAGQHETATELAEAANASLDLPAGAMDDPDHWVWEEALNAMGDIE